MSRLAYVTTGLGLMGFKYLVEALVVLALTGWVWTPLDYLIPSVSRYRNVGSTELASAIAVWSLPFIWIGVSMTVRRAIDAGLSAAWGLLFFVPLLNHLTMLVIAALPSRPTEPAASVEAALHPDGLDRRARAAETLRSALVAIGVGVAVASAGTAFSTLALGSYGVALFVGTPFIVGFVAGLLFNRKGARTVRGTVGVATATLVAAGGAIMLLALEGAACVAMAFPLALALVLVGALLGRAIAMRRHHAALPMAVALLATPLMLGASALPPRAALPLREVISSIDVAAPPSVVWNNVVGFSDLPPPSEWEFRHGIAYPMRARIQGQGAGAVRRCEFSTGAFVEPITTWDPPRRLAFDVSEQPPAMEELSPYAHVRAPHVSGYLQSRRGEFRLIDLPGGRTRLEGSTFYTLDVFPGWYWTRYADFIIGRIHMRVLRHIKTLSEARAPG